MVVYDIPHHRSVGSGRPRILKALSASVLLLHPIPVVAQSSPPAPAPSAARAAPTATQPVPTSTPAAAGDQAEDTRGDIVVTATREARGAQSVPISLTAIGSADLAKTGITSSNDLNRLAPSLYVQGAVSAGSPRFTLRGLTGTDTLPAGQAAIATYIDDVYQSSQYGIGSGLYDLQRVEVLRGPQGTTFGKNTTGGAIAYFSQTPTNTAEGYMTARLADGDQPQRFVEGAVNVPVIDDKLAIRISTRFDSKSAYMTDLAINRKRGGLETQAGRLQVRWTPTPDTVVNLYVTGTRNRGDTPLSEAQILGSVPLDRKNVNLTRRYLNDDYDNGAATLRVEQGLGTLSLTSLTHYRTTKTSQAQDVDSLPTDIFAYSSNAKATQYGQELRLSTDSRRPLSGIFGGYFEKDRVNDISADSAIADGPPFDYDNIARYVTRTETFALFASATYHLTSTLSAVGGIRKTWETRRFDARKRYFLDGNYDWTDGNYLFDGPSPVPPSQDLAFDLTQKARPWTWDATLNYNPARSLLVFARMSKGFRSGGFNPAAAITSADRLPAPIPPAFQGETVRSYEVGLKSDLFDRMLRLNAGAYHYDYSNQQVTLYNNGLVTTANAASAKVDGGELEVTAFLDPRLDPSGSVSYTDARYDKYLDPFIGADYSGNALNQAAKWSANGQLGYTVPVSDQLQLRGNTTWTDRSRIYFGSANDRMVSAGPQATGNIRFSLEPIDQKGFSIAAFVNNVTDRRALAGGFQFAPGYYVKYFETGRFYGLDVSFRF